MEISRKRFKELLFILINFMLILNISYGETLYRVDNFKIIIQINRDGSADISEQIFYEAYSINDIYHNIDYKGFGEIENLNIYFGKDGNYQLAKKGNGKEIGTYEVIKEEEVSKIKLYYPLNEEDAYFMFNYKIQNAITVYNDIVQFSKKLVEKDKSNNIDSVEVLIRLPEEVNQESIQAFWHGHLNEEINILNEREIRFRKKDYYQDEDIEINILFPKDIIVSQNKSIFKNEDGYEEIIKREKKLSNEIDLKRKIASYGNVIGDIVFGLCFAWVIFVVIFIYKNNGKKYTIKEEIRDFKDIPNNFSPAIIGAIVNKNIDSRQLLVTIMDLVRRGILLLDEKSGKIILRVKRDYKINDLKDYEKFILKWFIVEIGNKEEVFIEDVEYSINNKEKYIKFEERYKEWKTLISKELRKIGFRLEEPKTLGVALGFITGILSIPMGVIFLILFDSSKFIIFPFFVSFALIIYTMSIKRYSLEAEKLKAKFLSFKNFLLNYSSFKEVKFHSDDIREHYFVYAVAMGISKEVIEEYRKIFKENSIDEEKLGFERIERLIILIDGKERRREFFIITLVRKILNFINNFYLIKSNIKTKK